MREGYAKTPDQQAEEFVVGWRLLRQFLCRKLGRKTITFLAVFENHESGWPHLHILLRGGYIDHRVIRAWWEERFQSHHIDIRLAKNPRQRASYVSKYVAKAPQGFGHCKRYWCSQDWDKKKNDAPKPERDEYEWWEAITTRPISMARMAFEDGARVTFRGDEIVIAGWLAPDRLRWGIG
jgi:hypothetical protein